MFTKAHAHTELEIVKWAVLVVLAGALTLLLAGTAWGKGSARPPATLPAEVEQSAVPMPMDLPQIPMDAVPTPSVEDPFVVVSQTWNAIELQRAGRMDEAVEAWNRVRLPWETDVWRLVALGYAHLQLAEVDQAVAVLSEAKYAAPDNAVVHFAIGTLWLVKSETASEWPDAIDYDATRLVGGVPLDVAPNTRSMYRLAAVMCFERAVKLAHQVNLEEPLLPGAWMVPESDELAMPVATPTVRDLLSAFDGDTFEGRSHLALGVLHTERDMLEHAERHLDQAAALGQPTGAAFRDLGERLEHRGQFGDAMRVFLKSLSHGGGVNTVGEILDNAGKALLR